MVVVVGCHKSPGLKLKIPPMPIADNVENEYIRFTFQEGAFYSVQRSIDEMQFVSKF